MKQFKYLILGCALSLTGCELLDETPAPSTSHAVIQQPILVSINPSPPVAGQKAFIQGIGLSPAAPENLVLIQGQVVIADSHQFIAQGVGLAQEEIEVQIPTLDLSKPITLQVEVGDVFSNTLVINP